MRIFFTILYLFIFSLEANARKLGETEITTEEGIEVFQNEKFYLLKKNVKIDSDNFILIGDQVKIFFDKDLYDIKKIDAFGEVSLDSSYYKLKAYGERLVFVIDDEEIIITGKKSKLITDDIEMTSSESIKVDNNSGEFFINGDKSSLKAQNIYIEGNKIDGVFSLTSKNRDIEILNVFDNEISNVKTNDTDMFANVIKYDKENSLIELENNVKIVRNGEIITGDYGILNTETNSYKVKSNNSKKVKVTISNKNE